MIKRALIVASAAALFASAMPSIASADDPPRPVKCSGVNSCKGTSACKTASNSCKGQNSCKGMGWSEAPTQDECIARGGKVL